MVVGFKPLLFYAVADTPLWHAHSANNSIAILVAACSVSPLYWVGWPGAN
jgi:hypothetical protein